MNSRIALLLGSFLLSACAHHSQSTVAMLTGEGEAHIALGKSETRPGDRVTFFRHKCRRPLLAEQGVSDDPACEKVIVGEGTVTQNLGSDYSAVTLDQGVSVKEGDIVVAK